MDQRNTGIDDEVGQGYLPPEHPPKGGAHTAARDNRWWIAGAVALGLLVIALVFAVIIGNGLHWLLLVGAAIALVAAYVFFRGRERAAGSWKYMLAFLSMVLSLILIFIGIDRIIASKPVQPSGAAPSQVVPIPPAVPQFTPTAGAEVTIVPPPGTSPEPTLDEHVDEQKYDGEAVPSAESLAAWRVDLAKYRFGSDYNMKPGTDGYSQKELAFLSDWELDAIAADPDNPKFVTLGSEFGMGGKINGTTLHDYMRDHTHLGTVGKEGLPANHLDYDKSGRLGLCHQTTFAWNTLIWYDNDTNAPLAQWNGLGQVVPQKAK